MAGCIDLTQNSFFNGGELTNDFSKRSTTFQEVVGIDLSSDEDHESSSSNSENSRKRGFSSSTSPECNAASSELSNKRPAVALTLDDGNSTDDTSPSRVFQMGPEVIALDLDNSNDSVVYQVPPTDHCTTSSFTAPVQSDESLSDNDVRTTVGEICSTIPNRQINYVTSEHSRIASTQMSHNNNITKETSDIHQNLCVKHATSNVKTQRSPMNHNFKNSSEDQSSFTNRNWKDIARETMVNDRQEGVSCGSAITNQMHVETEQQQLSGNIIKKNTIAFSSESKLTRNKESSLTHGTNQESTSTHGTNQEASSSSYTNTGEPGSLNGKRIAKTSLAYGRGSALQQMVHNKKAVQERIHNRIRARRIAEIAGSSRIARFLDPSSLSELVDGGQSTPSGTSLPSKSHYQSTITPRKLASVQAGNLRKVSSKLQQSAVLRNTTIAGIPGVSRQFGLQHNAVRLHKSTHSPMNNRSQSSARNSRSAETGVPNSSSNSTLRQIMRSKLESNSSLRTKSTPQQRGSRSSSSVAVGSCSPSNSISIAQLNSSSSPSNQSNHIKEVFTPYLQSPATASKTRSSTVETQRLFGAGVSHIDESTQQPPRTRTSGHSHISNNLSSPRTTMNNSTDSPRVSSACDEVRCVAQASPVGVSKKRTPFSPKKGKRLRPRQPARNRNNQGSPAKQAETRFVMHIDDSDDDVSSASNQVKRKPVRGNSSESSGYSSDSFRIEATKNEGSFVRRGKEGRLIWKCRVGHMFKRHFKAVLDGKWCGQCSRLREMEWRQRAAELNRKIEAEWQQNAQHEQDSLFNQAKIRMAKRIQEEKLRQERIRQQDAAYQNGVPNHKSGDPYMCLGISKQATSDVIKKRYRKLALQYHPDKNTSPEANEMFCAFTKAYKLLLKQ